MIFIDSNRSQNVFIQKEEFQAYEQAPTSRSGSAHKKRSPNPINEDENNNNNESDFQFD